MNMFPKISLSAGALALGVALASVPAFAQEVWQTYPMTASTPAFGPGPVRPFVAAATPSARRHVYNYAPQAAAAQTNFGRCEEWQTYPMTAATPADYIATNCQ